MRFGLFYQASAADGQTHAERYGEMLDLIGLGDTLGFDVAWLAELHFGGAFSLLASPLMVVPVIAQRTRTIRIGTAVTLLPLHNPLSCAEQAATADLLSGGRLEFGVGRGSIPTQFHGFGIPVEENRARFDETLEIIRLAWTQERFSYEGRFYRVENLTVVPKPLQQPYPPVRVGVHTAENLPFERFCQRQGVFGDPQECIDRLQAARDEFGLCQIICWFDQGCMLPIAAVKRSMAQFADEVMPKV